MVAATCVVSHAFYFSNVFKLHSNSTKLSAIATKDGTIFREKIVKTHLNSKGHIEAAKAQRIAAIPKLQATTPMRKAFSTNEKSVLHGTITIS